MNQKLMLAMYVVEGLLFIVGSVMFWITDSTSELALSASVDHTLKGSLVAPGDPDGETLANQ